MSKPGKKFLEELDVSPEPGPSPQPQPQPTPTYTPPESQETGSLFIPTTPESPVSATPGEDLLAAIGGVYSPLEETDLTDDQQQFLEAALVRSFVDKFGKLDTYSKTYTLGGPSLDPENTVFFVKHDEYDVLVNATSQAYDWYARIYGSGNVPAYLIAYAQSSPDARREMIAAVTGLTQQTAPLNVGTRTQGTVVETPTADTLLAVINDPSVYDTLSPSEQQGVIQEAQAILSASQDVGEYVGRFGSTVATFATGNIDIALDDKEQAALRDAVGQLQTAQAEGEGSSLFTGTEVTAPTVGITRQTFSAEGTTIHLDETWAKAHPVKAAAVSKYVEDHLIGSVVQIGGTGIIARVGDLFGTLADVGGGWLGGAARWVSEKIDNADSLDEDDRIRLEDEREKLVSKIVSGDLSGEELEDATWAVGWADRQLDVDTGGSLIDYMNEGLNPREAGFGFANQAVFSLGLRPGDPGYDEVHGITYLASQFIFDPLTYGPGVAKGLRAAVEIPLIKDAEGAIKTVDGIIASTIHARLGQLPETWIMSRAADRAVENILDVKRALSDEEFLGRLQGLIPDQPGLRTALLNAEDDTDVRLLLYSSMTNQVSTEIDIAKYSRIEQTLSRRLNEGDALRARRAAIEAEGAPPVNPGKPEPWRTNPAIDPDEIEYVHVDDLLDQSKVRSLPRSVTEAVPGRTEAQNQELFESLRTEGLREPVEVDISSPYGMPFLSEGNHRAIFLKELGYEWIPVRTVTKPTDEVLHARFGIPAGEPIPLHLLKDIEYEYAGKLDTLFPNTFRATPRYSDELVDVTQRLAPYDATRTSDVARLGSARDILAGKPLNELPIDYLTAKQMRRFNPSTPYEKILTAVQHHVEEFPRPLLNTILKNKRRLKTADDTAREMNIAFRNLYSPTGLEGAEAAAGRFKRLYFLPDAGTLPEGALTDAVEQTRKSLRALGERMKVDPKTLDTVMGEFDLIPKGGAGREGYEWLTKRFWPMIIEAPTVPVSMRPAIQKLWKTAFAEAGTDVMTVKRGAGVYAEKEPVLFKEVVAPDGTISKQGVVLFRNDMLRAFTLPSWQEMRTVVSAWQRGLTKMKEGPKIGRAAARTWTGLARFAQMSTGVWKDSVLIGKVAALPARITGEAQFRMWGLGQKSLVNHAWDWLRSVLGRGEYSRWDHPYFATGSLIDDAATGIGGVRNLGRMDLSIINDDEGWELALSGRIGDLVGNPEVRYLIEYDTPEKFIAFARSEYGQRLGLQDLLGHWTSGAQNEIEAVTRLQTYLNQIIGKGEAADAIRMALRTGKLVVGKEVFTVGTREFGQVLKRLRASGKWEPSLTDIRSSYTEFLVTDASSNVFSGLKTWFYRNIYSRPEVAFARAPMYRQLAQDRFERLIALGYDEKVAQRLAHAEAARRTSNYMFKIGSHTSGEMTVRNIMPFFPAWRELSTTWLARIPEQIGGGSRVLGYAFLGRRAQIWGQTLQNVGILSVDEDGNYVFNGGPLSWLASKITGSDVEVKIPLQSLFGLLPFPDPSPGRPLKESLSKLAPGLGPIPSIILAELSKHTEFLDDFADFALPYGKDQTWGPGIADRLYSAFAMAFGWESTVPPWEFAGSPEFKQAMAYSAVIDGIRMAAASGDFGDAPDYRDFALDTPEGKDTYVRETVAYLEQVVDAGQKKAAGLMFLRAAVGATLPFSFGSTDAYKKEIDSTWAFLGDVPEDVRAELTSPMLDAFNAAYPDASWYTAGKFVDLHRTMGLPTDRTFSDFYDDFTSGLYQVRTPEEYAVWAYGMASYGVYQAQRDNIYQTFGGTPGKWLLSGYERQQALQEVDEEWDNFLRFTDQIAEYNPGGPPSFRSMFNQWQAARDIRFNAGEWEPTTSILQDRALDLKKQLSFLDDRIEAGAYDKVRGAIFDLIGDIPGFTDTDSVRGSVTSWYETVADLYYTKIDTLYGQANAISKPERGPWYDQIRRLANDQSPTTINGYRMPTPEQVAFVNKSPEEQQDWIIDKASLPPWWLSNFQQQMVGYKTNEQTEAFADYINEHEQRFKIATQDLSTSSTDYERARDAFDRDIAEKAESLGLSALWREWQVPQYKRIDKAIETQTPSWNTVVAWADEAWKQIEAEDYSPRSTSETARHYQQQFVARVEQLRRLDPELDAALTQVGRAVGGDEGPVVGADLYWQVFFEGYGSTPYYMIPKGG